MTWRSWIVVLLAALFGGAPFVALVVLYAPPKDPSVRVVTGPWRVQPGDLPVDVGAALATNDAEWKSVSLPAQYTPLGFKEHIAWFRREVELRAEERNEDYYFTAGGFSSGTATIFINGHQVGTSHRGIHPLKADIQDAEGFEISREHLRPGRNVIAMRIDWAFVSAGMDGVADPRLWFGPKRVLEPHLMLTVDVKRVWLNGSIALLIFISVLLLAVSLNEENSERRTLQQVAGLSILPAGFYIALNTGVGVRVEDTSTAHIVLFTLTLLLNVPSLFIFHQLYHTGRLGIISKLTAAVAVGFLAAYLYGGITGGITEWVAYYYDYFGLYVAASAVTLFVLYAQTRKRDAEYWVLALAVSFTIAGGAVDLLTDSGLLMLPHMYSIANSNLALSTGFVLVADFVRLSYVNRSLAKNLQASNDTLSVALHRADDAARLKDQLLANLSHELRTPLNTIINVPEGLMEEVALGTRVRCAGCDSLFALEPGEQYKPELPCPSCGAVGQLSAEKELEYRGTGDQLMVGLKSVAGQGHHLLGLIEQILDFRALESRTVDLHKTRFPAADLLEEVRAERAKKAEPKHLKIVVQASAQQELHVDRGYLKQTLLHLLDNAIRHSFPNGTITLSAQQRAVEMELAVRDEGEGVAPENHHRIFESFRQVDGGSTRPHGGFGIGLSLSRAAVELHGGKLTVESELGKGATFFIRIPLT